MKELNQTAYIVSPKDNVATAMGNVEPGPVRLTGKYDRDCQDLSAEQAVPFGHKLALRDIVQGELIIKYHAVIGEATHFIQRGCHVHLHNMKSLHDERAASFDHETAASTDMEYTLY